MGWFSERVAQAKNLAGQFTNQGSRDALVATVAMMAMADKKVTPEEEDTLADLIVAHESLSFYDPEQLREQFLADVKNCRSKLTRIKVLNKILAVKGKPVARDCIEVALVVANEDGNFSSEEKALVVELCDKLDLDSATYLK